MIVAVAEVKVDGQIEQIEEVAEGRRIAWNLESIRLFMRVEEMAVL